MERSSVPPDGCQLELTDVHKYHRLGSDVVKAVNGVSLTITPGECVALYGPSGSGKTTLLLLAAGLLQPDSGRIQFGEDNLNEYDEHTRAVFRRRQVGFVFQSFHLMPRASALDNAMIKLPADGYTLREARRRAAGWLEVVGLGERQMHTAEQLSMGERQRVAIARALANEPALLLADEPTGNLDSARTREILTLLRDICHDRSIPGLFVTHDLEALAFVDRVYTLRDGRLTEGLHTDLSTARS